MGTLWQDIRFGLRMMVRNPGFTVVVVAILALGIGATSAIVSVMSGVLFQAGPYDEPERLVLLNSARLGEGTVQAMPISYLDFRDWRAEAEAFEAMALYSQPQSFNLLAGGEARHVRGEMVSAEYFPLLGIDAARGRVFSADEDRTPGSPRIVVLSHDLWRQVFGEHGDLSGGLDVVLNGESYEVVGVTPAGFRGLTDNAELWMPVTMASVVMGPPFLERRPWRWLLGVGRLKPGVGLEQARSAMATVTSALAQEYPDTNREVGALLTPIAEAWFGDLEPALRTLLGAAIFVLLIACNNVAHLLGSRALARQRELAVRSAHGASRLRLVRQLLTESVLLALIAGAVGLWLAHRFTGNLVALSGVELKSFADVTIDLQVVAVITAVALAAGIGFGLMPALLVARTSLQEHLREGSKGSGGAANRRFQDFLVVAEVALALVLLIGSGLMVKSFQQLRETDLGFRPERLATFRLYLKDPRYEDPEVVRSLSRQLMESLENVPGADAVAIEGPAMPTDEGYGGDYLLEGKDPQDPKNRILLVIHHVSPGYFDHLGIPLVRGREFTLQDNADSLPAVVVSRTMAERLWSGEDPVGQGLRPFRSPPDAPWLRVVGVVDDVRHMGIKSDPLQPPDVYFPLFQTPPQVAPILNFMVRAAADTSPESLLKGAEQAIRGSAPHLPVYEARTMAERLERQIGRERFLVAVMGLFTVAALALAGLGIYGVLSLSVVQRTREFGIRMALGADRRKVLGLVVKKAAGLTAIGIMVGLVMTFVLTFVLTALLESLLSGLSTLDPLTGVVMMLVLAGVAFVATCLPALRATRIQPVEALRVE